MKKLMVALMLVASAAMAQNSANYIWNVDWSIAGAFSPTSGDDPLQEYEITWILINATAGNAVIDTMVSANNAITFTDARDRVLEYTEYMMAISSTYYGATDAFDSPQNLYQRIELRQNDVLQYYWESPTTSAVTPVLYEAGAIPGTPSPMADNTVFVNSDDWVAVPEPATMSLLGLGALAMVLRRKLRK